MIKISYKKHTKKLRCLNIFSFKLRKKMLRITAFILCLINVLCLCSCWSQRELETLAIVLGTALDVGDLPDTLKLTAQVVKASEIGSNSSTGGKTGEKAYVNISNTDESVLSAVRGLTHQQNRALYFPHNEVLIFSSDLAKLDIAEGLDAFTRDYEARLNVNILISRGQASEILKEDVDLEKMPALHIASMMNNQQSNSETVVITLRDFIIATLDQSTAPVVPMIELHEADGKKHVILKDTAVFKHNRMIGELDKVQTRGLLWVTNKFKSGVITVNTQWGQVVLEILHASSKLKPIKGKDGKIHMELKIYTDGSVQSNETTEDMSNIKNVEMLKAKMSESIIKDIRYSLMQARTLSSDVFGFGEAIRRHYPKEWEKMKDNWDANFPSIELDTHINVKLRSTSGLIKPVVSGGK